MRDPNVEKLATELVQHTSIVGTCSNTYMIYPHPIKIRQKGKQRSSLLVGGTEQIQLHAALAIWCQNDLQKRVNRRLNTWRNGCFGKMDDHPVHTTPNHHPLKMDVLPKTFLQIILAVILYGYIVRHSSMSPQPAAATTFAFPSV